MERLTQANFDYCVECCPGETMIGCGFYKGETDVMCSTAARYNRLAAYEDMGLEPEQIRSIVESGAKLCEAYEAVDTEIGFAHLKELMDAEAEGRILALPCAPGAEVWVVERDEDGCAVDVSGYMFLAKAGDAVILTAYVNNLENVQDTLAYHMQETAENYDTDLAVFPADDCYTTREEAKAALGKERDV